MFWSKVSSLVSLEEWEHNSKNTLTIDRVNTFNTLVQNEEAYLELW